MIDSQGVLCGHSGIYSKCGGFFYNYNLVRADSLVIKDGSNFGLIVYLKYFQISPCLQNFWTGTSKGGYAFTCGLFDTVFNDSPETDTVISHPIIPLFSVSVYPNPFLSYFIINTEVSNINSNVTLNIYNLLGRKIDSIIVPDAKSALTIFTSDWGAGMYFLRFENGDTILQVNKIIKVK